MVQPQVGILLESVYLEDLQDELQALAEIGLLLDFEYLRKLLDKMQAQMELVHEFVHPGDLWDFLLESVYAGGLLDVL